VTIVGQVLSKLVTLSEHQQRQVLEFIETMQPPPRPPLIDLYGMFAGYDTTEEEIAEARREMWGTFPHEDI
jgi:hypothetical protein